MLGSDVEIEESDLGRRSPAAATYDHQRRGHKEGVSSLCLYPAQNCESLTGTRCYSVRAHAGRVWPFGKCHADGAVSNEQYDHEMGIR